MPKPSLQEALENLKAREQQLVRMFDGPTLQTRYFQRWKLKALRELFRAYRQTSLPVNLPMTSHTGKMPRLVTAATGRNNNACLPVLQLLFTASKRKANGNKRRE